VKTHETLMGLTRYLMDVRDAEGYKMWDMVMDNCWETAKIEMRECIGDLEDGEAIKNISGHILVSIPQNENDVRLFALNLLYLVLL
jgi:hypothetical protein